jgi:hypothetical protein
VQRALWGFRLVGHRWAGGLGQQDRAGGDCWEGDRGQLEEWKGRRAVSGIEVEVRDGRPMTSSLDVAERFGKRHDDVLRAIKGP